MIDFRYHLVSIVSIFLALAVGIVLGAGPLQGQIGDTLTSEITQLRKDKTELRGQVTDLEQQAADRASFEETMLPRLVAGTATGRAVALVVLPGVDAGTVTDVAETVVEAGGTVASTTRLDAAWVSQDAAKVAQREDLADGLAAKARVPSVATNDSAPPLLDRVLAAALTADTATTGQEDDRAVLASLVKAKLVEVDSQAAVSAQLVVVLAAPLTAGEAKAQETEAKEWVQLARAFDSAAAGAVVASNSGTSAADQSTSVVRAIRQDAAASKAVATVDDVGEPMGLASILLALAQQESGTTGHYGRDEGATAPFAPLPGTP